MEKFLIPLNGLPNGKAVFDFSVGKEFFESFDNTEIIEATLEVSAEVEKTSGHTDIDCNIDGQVSVSCDRCLEPVAIPVEITVMLRVRFGEEDPAVTAEDENLRGRESLWIVADSEELDLSQTVYDYVCLSLPSKRVHPDGGCNPEAMKYLNHDNSEQQDEGSESANPFSVLNGLFQN